MKRKAIFLLYRVLQWVVSPVLLVYLLFRGIRNRQYFSTLGQRIGRISPSWQQTVSASIWLHAVSVGEVLAAIPLLEQIRRRTPRAPIFVSTSTLAGRHTADKRLAGLADAVFYAPIDFVWCVRRVLRRLRPSMVVILETEIWPNLYRETKRIGAGLVLVNGRISDRALPRYRRLAPILSAALECCDAILAQSGEMKRRFELAGAPPERVHVGGNLKYDFTPAAIAPDSPVQAFIAADTRPIWIAASTSADERVVEEDFVLAAQRLLPGWRLIVAPRKPERFDEVAGLIERSGLSWTRRSGPINPRADVLLLDSIGELSGLFLYAAVVFMGGSLADRGGHNILEPAIFGKPVIVGPHMENFREVAADFEQLRAIVRIVEGSGLHEAILRAAAEKGLGERARAAAKENRGAASRAADVVTGLYDGSYPVERPPQPAMAILWAMSQLWRVGSLADRKGKAGRSARLPVPVVSVGNITTGGTGKTPVVIELLRAFRNSNPALLTRGHGRTAREGFVYLDGDDNIPRAITGDEARLCMEAARIPIGIGPDRHAMGRQLLNVVEVQVFFLDDGFQHLQLHRDFDLVLIDALQPFGGGHLVPLGRLREPLEGLSRASAFLITRADEVPNTQAIESVLRHYNPRAPVFRARTLPAQWRDGDNAEVDPDSIRARRSVAFCGLGNPEAFWQTLRGQGIQPLARYVYGDHHLYRPSDLRQLARHARDLCADVLITTAKDAVNLDSDYPSILGDIPLCWLEIRTAIEGREELLRRIRKSF